MSSQKDELQKKVEELKQDADVQRALKEATPTEKRDKFVIGTHLFCWSFWVRCTSC